MANFIPMNKKDHETDKCNYRPISLLSVSGKIMESAVASSIMSHISDNNLYLTSVGIQERSLYWTFTE